LAEQKDIPPSPDREKAPGNRQAEIEAQLRDIVNTTGASNLSRRLAEPLLDRLPGNNTAPPNEVPDSWHSYDATVRPVVDHFFRDTQRVLRTWTNDPVVLCCLIRNLAALDTIQRIVNGGATRGIKVLHQIRAILDLLIGILSKDISLELDQSLDFLRFIMIGVIGSIIGTLDSLRRHIQDAIFRRLNFTSDSVLNRCLPFGALIKVVLSAIQDPINGIFARLAGFITDWSNHIRALIHVRYNCGSLQYDNAEARILTEQANDLEQEIVRIEGSGEDVKGEGLTRLREQRKQVQAALHAVQSKISLNKGMPLIGTAGCYIRKIEFVQQLKFYRRLVDLVIQGLQRGILCANTSLDALAHTHNPLNELGLDRDTYFPNPSRTPIKDVFPTDDELRKFVKENFEFDDPAIERALGLGDQRSDGDATGQDGSTGTLRNPTAATQEEVSGLLSQIRTIETLADCTSVMSNDLITEVASTFARLGRQQNARI